MGHKKQRPIPHPLKAHLWQISSGTASQSRPGRSRARIDNTAVEQAANDALDAHYDDKAARTGAQDEVMQDREVNSISDSTLTQPSQSPSPTPSMSTSPSKTASLVTITKSMSVTKTATLSTAKRSVTSKAKPSKVTKQQRTFERRKNPPRQTASSRLRNVPSIAQLASEQAQRQSSMSNALSVTPTMAPPSITIPAPAPIPATAPLSSLAPTTITVAQTTADTTPITSSNILSIIPPYRARALAEWAPSLMLPPWLVKIEGGRRKAERERKKVCKAMGKPRPLDKDKMRAWFAYGEQVLASRTYLRERMAFLRREDLTGEALEGRQEGDGEQEGSWEEVTGLDDRQGSGGEILGGKVEADDGDDEASA